MRGLMGGFYRLSEWIMRLAVINLLWLICSLPCWFIGYTGYVSVLASMNANQIPGLILWTIILLAVLSPFTLFPATSAMFSVARKWVMGETDVPLFRTYFQNYRQNYKQAMLGGLVYSAVSAVLLADFLFLLRQEGFQLFVYMVIAAFVLLMLSLLHFFSLLSHFHMTFGHLLKNAFILTFGSPIRTIMMGLGTAVVMTVSVQPMLTFLIPFFSGSMIAAFVFHQFYQVIAKLSEKTGVDYTGSSSGGAEGENQEMKS